MEYYLIHPNSNSSDQNQLLFHVNSKRLIKFLFFSSLFSVFCILLHSLNLKQFLMSYYTFVDKSYMFLLCNGLLLLIAINSRFLHSSSSDSPTTLHLHHHPLHYHKTTQLEFKVSAETTASEAPIAPEIKVMEIESLTPPEEEKSLMIVEQPEGNPQLLDTVEDEEEGKALIIMDDEDGDHDVVHDTEELNKKCEEFIKKMREAFRN